MTPAAYRACPGGVYRGDRVTVRARRPGGRAVLPYLVRTPLFDVARRDDGLLVEHGLSADEVSDDLAGLLSEQLFLPGWLRGAALFEEVFTGIVRTCHADGPQAWTAFYRNTIDAIDRAIESPGGQGSIAGFAPVHAHVGELVSDAGVLELGSCFGFQSLRLARSRTPVIASDISAPSVELLADMSRRLDLPVRTVTADAAHVGLPDRVCGTVLAIHLLEHVDDQHAVAIVREACRLASRRVVVAVPFEDEPSEQFGHLRRMTTDDLWHWAGAAPGGWSADVHEHHGGWLVLDRDGSASRRR